MKKLKILIVVLIMFFSFFLIMHFRKKSYVIKYKVDKYDVVEQYDKKSKAYYLEVKTSNKSKYYFIITDKYYRKKKLVDNIKELKDDNKKCMILTFNKKNVTPSCTKDGEYISYTLLDGFIKKKLGKKYYKNIKEDSRKTYKNININTLLNKKVYVWNYHGFYELSDKEFKDIKLFKNDTYDASLIGSINSYLLIPDYNEEYEYSKFKVLNIEDNKITELKLNDNISSDSYILGTNLDSIYYFDRKYLKEYEIVPHKLKYRKVNPFIYNKGKKESKTSLSLKNKETTFTYNDIYDYTLINDHLYQLNKFNKEKVLISDKEVKSIVKKSNNEVYYISGDSLYTNYPLYGELKMLDYFELNFNYKNIIFIF